MTREWWLEHKTNAQEVIGLNIESNLLRNGMSQTDLANKCDSDPNTISRYVRGKSMPNVLVLYKMSDVLGVSIDSLLKGVKV